MTFDDMVQKIPVNAWDYEVVLKEAIIRDGDQREDNPIKYTIDDDKKQIIIEGLE